MQTEEKSNEATVDIILANVKDQAASQMAQVGVLDGKANFGLTAASLLTAGIASLHGAYLSTQRLDPTKASGTPLLTHLAPTLFYPLAYGLTSVACVLYLWIVWSAYQAYRIRAYKIVPDPAHLIDAYWAKSAYDTKATLATTIADAIEKNDAAVNAKATWAQRVIMSLVFEAAALLALVLVQLTI